MEAFHLMFAINCRDTSNHSSMKTNDLVKTTYWKFPLGVGSALKLPRQHKNNLAATLSLKRQQASWRSAERRQRRKLFSRNHWNSKSWRQKKKKLKPQSSIRGYCWSKIKISFNHEFGWIFSEFKVGKTLDRPTMVRVLKTYSEPSSKENGSDDNFDVIVNTQTVTFEMWADPFDRARWRGNGWNVSNFSYRGQSHRCRLRWGDECYEQLTWKNLVSRSIMAARQTLISRIMDLEKDEVYKKYVERLGEIVVGEASQIMKKEVLVLDDAT